MNLKKKIITTVGIIGLLGSTFATTVEAQTTDVSVDLTGGELILTAVPGRIGFNESTISAEDQTILGSVLESENNSSRSLTVTDARGTGSGWHVTASMSEFKKNGQPSLIGSSINLSAPSINSNNTTQGAAPSVTNTKLSPGTSAVPINAAVTQGAGQWNFNWLRTGEASLSIPAGAGSLGSHSTIITWILHDTPNGE